MLTAQNISYDIGNVKILRDINCSLQPGKLSMILGPNGAGKTSLLKILAAQLKPGAGTVLYRGIDPKLISSRALAQKRSVLSQNIHLAFPLTVKEVVLLGRSPHFTMQPGTSDVKACHEAMEFFDVGEMAQRQYLSLSGGEKQRVQFARVLAQIWQQKDTEELCYLFLDEPLTFLDIGHQVDFMKKIKKLLSSWNLLVVGVVHDLNLAARYADQVLLLNKGQLHASGTPEQVLKPHNIKIVYGVEALIHYENNRPHILF